MRRYTNKHGAPDPLFALLGRESYSRGDSIRSCTQLIDSPRLHTLREKRGHEISEDISDRIWALFGTAIHKLIEEGSPNSEWEIKEERMFADVLGWRVSGAVDLQVLTEDSAVLWDWKVTRVWSVADQKREWVNQLNFLAYLFEATGRGVPADLRIGALLRDWSRKQSELDPNYPQSPIHVVEIPLWSFAEREAYVHERVRLHQQAEMLYELEEELPDCTPDEMWEVPPTWAVMKKDGKRASRVFASEEQAVNYAASKTGYVVDERRGDRLRCSKYCEVRNFCSQRRRWVEGEAS